VFVGMTSDFAGPYLYVKKGEYQLEFRLDGYETKTVDLKTRPGAVINISDKLKKIPGAKQYGSYDNPEPEGGVQRFWTKEQNSPVHPVEVGGDNGYGQGAPSTLQDQNWRGGSPQGQAPHSPQRPVPPTDEGEPGEAYAPPGQPAPPPPVDS